MFKSSYVPKGQVTLKLLNKDNKVIDTRGSNIVVYNGRHIISRLLFDESFVNTNGTVNTLKIAGGAVPPGGDHFNPISHGPTDEGLFETDPTKIKTYTPLYPSLSTVASSSRPTAVFSKVVTSMDVDMIVNEIGLFFGLSGVMFAHYTFSSIDLLFLSKNSLEITWTFYL